MLFTKKTSAEPKRWHWILIIIIIMAAIGSKMYYRRWPTTEMHIGGRQIKILLADTYPRRLEGWSNKDDMGKYHGMLFIFPGRDDFTMVMRDMRFPLDIVWIDGETIVDIAPNAQPEPGRAEAELTRYSPRVPATHVLELPAGFTQANGIKIGDKASLD